MDKARFKAWSRRRATDASSSFGSAMSDKVHDMPDDPKSVVRLRKFARDRLAPIDPVSLRAELEGTSDRAVIIVLGVFIDDALEHAIAQKMRRLTDDEYVEAFKHDGPLGSFSAQIDMAYWFGIFELPQRKRFHDLREMRNACAHAKRPISLADEELANVCRRFLRDAKFKAYEETPKGLRIALIAECFWCFNVLITSEAEAARNLRATAKLIQAERDASPKTPPEQSEKEGPPK